MTVRIDLFPEPLTRDSFAPYGDVIEAGGRHFEINAGAIERFDDLARIDVVDVKRGHAAISMARCNRASELPMTLRFVERHPLGSQAFIPLSAAPLFPVVAPAGDHVDPESLRAFISNGHQGINYHRGIWHVPLICLDAGQQFVIVDRAGQGQNCEEFHFGHHDIVLHVHAAATE